ncbi:MAG: RNA polymerase sigma factor [Opitutaceae bacterium]
MTFPPPCRAESSIERSRWFSEEIRPHEPALRGFLRGRFPSVPDHDDIVQDTYARLVRAKDGNGLSNPKGFLFTTARNAALDLVRRKKRSRWRMYTIQTSRPS